MGKAKKVMAQSFFVGRGAEQKKTWSNPIKGGKVLGQREHKWGKGLAKQEHAPMVLERPKLSKTGHDSVLVEGAMG